MAKRNFRLTVTQNTDWVLVEEHAKSIYEGKPVKENETFGVMMQQNGKLVSMMCQYVSKDDLEAAQKLKILQEEVTVDVEVFDESGKKVSSESFGGKLIDALTYVHKTYKGAS